MFQVKFLFLDGPDLYTGGKYSTCIFLVSFTRQQTYVLMLPAQQEQRTLLTLVMHGRTTSA